MICTQEHVQIFVYKFCLKMRGHQQSAHYTVGASWQSLILLVQQLCVHVHCSYVPCTPPSSRLDNVTDHFTPLAAGIIRLHSPVLMAWGLIGPVLTGLVAMVGAGGGFSSTFSWQTPGGSVSVSGGLLESLSTFGALLPICLLCCCSEKNRCVDWRTSALCFALKNEKQWLRTLQR